MATSESDRPLQNNVPPSGIQKADFPTRVPTSGFPARPLTRYTAGKGTGQWIIEYQAEQRRRLKVTLTSAIKEQDIALKMESTHLTAPGNTPASTSARHRKILDEKLLLRLGYVEEPADLCISNVSSMELQSFSDHHMSEFTNLVRICASDNYLPLEAFELFPVLEDLELSLNNISNISIRFNSFPALNRLDLSYNNLSGTAIVALGSLPLLKELHLTGNNIVSLPLEMSRPQEVPNTTNSSTCLKIRFPRLEKLWLDDNRLTDTTTFAILAGLRKLKYLNLDNNELYKIPHLKLLGTSSIQQHQHDELPQIHTKKVEELIKTDALIDSSSSPPPSEEQPVQSQHMTHLSSNAPFPQLYTLSLMNNIIINSEGLIACGTWPALKEVIITGNPIVNVNNGLPHIIKQELVERDGISIIRSKPTVVRKSWITNKAKDFKKISLAPPPTIPKRPLLLALEPPPLPLSLTAGGDKDDYNFDENLSEDSTLSYHTNSVSDGRTSRASPGIFLTQPQNEEELDQKSHTHHTTTLPTPNKSVVMGTMEIALKEEKSVAEEYKRKRQKEQEDFSDIPEKYKGFESLLVAKEDYYDDGPPLPTDTYSCARALKHALKNPLLLTNINKSSQLVTSTTTTPQVFQYLKKTPSTEQYHNIPAVSTRQQEIDVVLNDLKTHEITVETSLVDIMNKKEKIMLSNTTQNDQRRTSQESLTENEGKKLFKYLQVKYNHVREKSLETLAALDSVQMLANSSSGMGLQTQPSSLV